MKRLLILGSNGFIGKHLLDCLRRDHSFRVLTPDRSTWDLNDQKSLETVLIEANPDLVVNLVSISSTTADRDALYKVNAFGNLNLLEALAVTGFKGRLIYVSSSNVYGSVTNSLISENTRPHPLNHYSCAKLLAENFCSMFSDRFDSIVVRPFNIIGTGQNHPSLYLNLLITLCAKH